MHRIAMSLTAVAAFSGTVAHAVAQTASSPASQANSGIDWSLTFSQRSQVKPLPMANFRGLILFKIKVNDRDAWAILDSASSHTLIDLNFARSVGLKMGPVVSSIDIGPSRMSERLLEGVKLDVPGQFFLSGMGLGLDLQPFAKTIGHPVDVIIGRDNLSIMSVLVSSSTKTITFAQSGQIMPESKSVGLPIVNGDQLQASVNGVAVNLVIDLGFNGIVKLVPDAWKRVVPADATVRNDQTSSFDGVLRPSFKADNATVIVGPITAEGATIGTGQRMAITGDGVIGTSFLTRFDFILDLRAKRFVAIPFSGPPPQAAIKGK